MALSTRGVVGAILLCCLASWAAASEGAWVPDVDVGANFAEWSSGGSAESAYSTYYGFYVGGLFSIPVGALQLRPGLSYARRGTEIPADPESVRVDYLDVPILVEFRPNTGRVRPVVFGGFVVSRRLGVASSEFPEADLNDLIRSTEASGSVGAGLEFRRVTVVARYAWGLTDVQASPSETSTHSRCLSLGVQIRLARGRPTRG